MAIERTGNLQNEATFREHDQTAPDAKKVSLWFLDTASGTLVRVSDTNQLPSEANIKALTNFQTSGSNSITTSPAKVATPPLTGRKTVAFTANSANTASIYIGHNTDVTAITGYELAIGASVEFDVDDSFDSFYARSGTGTQSLHWAEVA